LNASQFWTPQDHSHLSPRSSNSLGIKLFEQKPRAATLDSHSNVWPLTIALHWVPADPGYPATSTPQQVEVVWLSKEHFQVAVLSNGFIVHSDRYPIAQRFVEGKPVTSFDWITYGLQVGEMLLVSVAHALQALIAHPQPQRQFHSYRLFSVLYPTSVAMYPGAHRFDVGWLAWPILAAFPHWESK